MSAIFGIVHLDGAPAVEAELSLMSRALAAYGPDGDGVWMQGNVGLGQLLMHFTAEDCLEHQPAIHGEGKHVLVADARIDNRPELMHELGISSVEARELPDSAFILRAYDKWGADCATYLIGAFVFALYDLRRESVLLARSPMGERSLFYYETPKVFAFASAPKGLFALPFVPREINRQSVADFLAFAPKEPGSSFFSRINRLQPGHSIVVRREGFKSRQYRELHSGRSIRFARDSDYVEAFNTLFDRVIADQRRSLGPVGVSMSGGLDSTSIGAVAALQLRREGGPLHTFTEVPREGFKGALPENRYADETPYVEAMARKYGNLNTHFIPSGSRFYLDELDSFFAAAEAPLEGASNRAWIEDILSEARQRNVRVLLTGAPGNLTVSWEGLGLLSQLAREWKWGQAFREARALAALDGTRSAARILAGCGLMPLLPDRVWLMFKRFQGGKAAGTAFPLQKFSPLRAEFRKAERVEERAHEKGYHFRFRTSPRNRAVFLFRRSDARGDARRGHEALFGVQKRDPLADMRLVEFCLSLPEDQYLREGKSRWLIRRAMADRLPAEVLDNNRRGLQSADWLESLRASYSRILEDLGELERSSLAGEAIDLPRMRHLVNQLPSVRADAPSTGSDYRSVLESGLTMGRFLKWVEAGTR